ncbi:MAG TPA: hypothetical protein VML57_20445 [Burkholderiales bacterium]|nr:hypothetical protein [Burkholderiales bacterium]
MRPTGVRFSSLGRGDEHVRFAGAAGEFYPVEVLEHLDREVATDTGAVAKRGCSNHAARARFGAGHLLELVQRPGQEEPGLRDAHDAPLLRKSRERGLELPGLHDAGGRKLGEARRAKLRRREQGLEPAPERFVGGIRLAAVRGQAQARAFAHDSPFADELLDQLGSRGQGKAQLPENLLLRRARCVRRARVPG